MTRQSVKIILGEYIDFSRLIPKNRVLLEEDNCMEMINQGGHTYWVLAADHNSVIISNFARWEQAFHVYSNIYTKQFLAQASELIQYNHIIHTASLSFAWENVYQYDKEFRLHLSQHPEHSWAVILQQAWSMYLKDQIQGAGSDSGQGSVNHHQSAMAGGKVKSKKLCFDFNAGNCMYGQRCHFEHRCGVCGKYRHGTYNCHRVKNRFTPWGNTDHNDRDHSDWEKCRGQPHNNRDQKDKNTKTFR